VPANVFVQNLGYRGVNGQVKMGLNGHEKSPTNGHRAKKVKARSLSKLIGNHGQYGFEGASKLDESGDYRENPLSIVTKG